MNKAKSLAMSQDISKFKEAVPNLINTYVRQLSPNTNAFLDPRLEKALRGFNHPVIADFLITSNLVDKYQKGKDA
jgi:hypothetical protein